MNLFARVKKLHSIPASQFYPRPQVNGAIMQIDFCEDRRDVPDDLLNLIKIGFSSPRKTLRKNLKNSRKYKNESIDNAFFNLDLSDKVRAAEIEGEIWEKLDKELMIKNAEGISSKL